LMEHLMFGCHERSPSTVISFSLILTDFCSASSLTSGSSVIVHLTSSMEKSSFVFCYATVTNIDLISNILELRSVEAFPNELLAKGRNLCLDEDQNHSQLKGMRGNILQLLSAQQPRLKDLIINFQPPQFDSSLGHSEKQLTSLPEWLRMEFYSLNLDQQAMVTRGMRCLDYLLVQGMPGSGKTTAIAVLSKILCTLGKNVLISAHTNSAVDNIMRKCCSKNFPPGSLIRVGNRKGIAKDIQNDGRVTKLVNENVTSTKDLDGILLSRPIILGATCLGVSSSSFGPLFGRGRLQFDVCIIDEASQIPEPLILAPLLCCKSFILVGDSYQLPPLSNKKVKTFGTSLFERLLKSS
jgi:DNA replication ATP-dependent helicase Dna2